MLGQIEPKATPSKPPPSRLCSHSSVNRDQRSWGTNATLSLSLLLSLSAALLALPVSGHPFCARPAQHLQYPVPKRLWWTQLVREGSCYHTSGSITRLAFSWALRACSHCTHCTHCSPLSCDFKSEVLSGLCKMEAVSWSTALSQWLAQLL